jgi:ankyrin repeat protein
MTAFLRTLLILLLATFSYATVPAQMAEPVSSAKETREQATPQSTAGESELIEAIQKGDIGRVLLLLENGVSPDATDDEKTPALVLAVKLNRADIVEALLKRNAKIDQLDDEGTALMTAATMGRANLVKLLIAHGADVNHKDRAGHSVLMCAAFAAMYKSNPAWLTKQFLQMDDDDEDKLAYLGDEHVAVVKLLLAAGADVNVQAEDCDMTALMAAAIGGNVEVGKILLAHGANPNLRAGELTALSLAMMGETPEELQKMLSSESDNESKQMLLNWLQFTRPGRLEFAAMLKKAGAKK